jgi:hypothetical protein
MNYVSKTYLYLQKMIQKYITVSPLGFLLAVGYSKVRDRSLTIQCLQLQKCLRSEPL